MFDKTTKPNHADLEALSGPPPVLRSEDRELYGQVRVHFMECLGPADILKSLLVQRLIDDAWFIKRYTRHQAVTHWNVRTSNLCNFRSSGSNRRTPERKHQRVISRSVATRSPAAIAHLVRLENQVLTRRRRSTKFSSASQVSSNTTAN